MKPLQIALATPEYVTEHNYFGGLANYLHRLAKELVRRNHTVHVVTYSNHPTQHFVHEGVHIHRIWAGQSQFWLNRLSSYRFREVILIVSHSWSLYHYLRRLHQTHKLDFVQYASYRLPGLFAIPLLKVPYTLRASSLTKTTDAIDKRATTLGTRLNSWLEIKHFQAAQNVFAPSYALQRILRHECGLKRVAVIPTPMYLETTAEDDTLYKAHLSENPYLLYFGRLQRLKGFEVLSRALPLILDKLPDLQVAIIGNEVFDTEYGSLKEYALNLVGSNKSRLTFLDSLPHPQLYPIIRNARLVVLPSLVDNLPNACLEAMALGRPVVGTIGTSLDEIIEPEKTGFLVQPGDPQALAEVIVKNWQRPDLAVFGAQAQEAAKRFHPDNVIPQLLDYYDAILADQQQSTEI